MKSSYCFALTLVILVTWTESAPAPDPLDTINININEKSSSTYYSPGFESDDTAEDKAGENDTTEYPYEKVFLDCSLPVLQCGAICKDSLGNHGYCEKDRSCSHFECECNKCVPGLESDNTGENDISKDAPKKRGLESDNTGENDISKDAPKKRDPCADLICGDRCTEWFGNFKVPGYCQKDGSCKDIPVDYECKF